MLGNFISIISFSHLYFSRRYAVILTCFSDEKLGVKENHIIYPGSYEKEVKLEFELELLFKTKNLSPCTKDRRTKLILLFTSQWNWSVSHAYTSFTSFTDYLLLSFAHFSYCFIGDDSRQFWYFWVVEGMWVIKTGQKGGQNYCYRGVFNFKMLFLHPY